MFCSQCGTSLPTGSRFCSSCGATITTSAPQAPFAPTFASAAQPGNPQAGGWSQSGWNQYTGALPGQFGTIEYAGFFRRWGANILDGFVVGIAYFVVAFGIALLVAIGGGLNTEEDSDGLAGLLWIAWFFAQWLYFAFMESSSWQATLGKRALGIIVTDESGDRLSFGRATGRYWAKFFSWITLLIGFLMAGFTQKKQALHDMVAGTLVVVGKKP